MDIYRDEGKKGREKRLSFEEALTKLENIVRTLEVGEVGLEEALRLYEEGNRLSRRCLEELEKIEKKLEVVKLVDGKILRGPLEESVSSPSGVGEEE
ncbi:MAG: exodeoxyribonuclease VII small subunit [Thermoplasmata archaeon]